MLLKHPRRKMKLLEPVTEFLEKKIPNRIRRRPIDGEIPLIRPYGNRIAFEELTLPDGRRVETIGDLPFCPSCGYDLQQKIANGKYALVKLKTVERLGDLF